VTRLSFLFIGAALFLGCRDSSIRLAPSDPVALPEFRVEAASAAIPSASSYLTTLASGWLSRWPSTSTASTAPNTTTAAAASAGAHRAKDGAPPRTGRWSTSASRTRNERGATGSGIEFNMVWVTRSSSRRVRSGARKTSAFR